MTFLNGLFLVYFRFFSIQLLDKRISMQFKVPDDEIRTADLWCHSTNCATDNQGLLIAKVASNLFIINAAIPKIDK